MTFLRYKDRPAEGGASDQALAAAALAPLSASTAAPRSGKLLHAGHHDRHLRNLTWARASLHAHAGLGNPEPSFMLFNHPFIRLEGNPATMSEVFLQAISGAYMRGQLHAPRWKASRSVWLPVRAPCWRSCRPPSMQQLKPLTLAQLALQVCQAAPFCQISPVQKYIYVSDLAQSEPSSLPSPLQATSA